MEIVRKKIVIITSGQPYANPRTVKEATALANEGYDVTVIYTPLSPWADEFDKQLFASTSGIKWIMAGKHLLQNPLNGKFTRLKRKMNEILVRTKLSKNYNAAYILFYGDLWNAARKIKADLYIAHNLGALPIAVKAASKYKSKAAFDLEDYYRGESINNNWYYQVGIKIEDEFIPRLHYMVAASTLIAKAYQCLFPGKEIVVINNVFSKRYLSTAPSAGNEYLELFWFSQYLGINRGLETIIGAMNILHDKKIKLHLLGECTMAYKDKLTKLCAQPGRLHFISPVSLEKIFSIASQYDVGMASEVPYNENRDICLTNKLFSYMLAGNCIMASDTKSQKRFMSENPGIGLLYENNNARSLADKLQLLLSDRCLLLQCKTRSLELAAEKFNWETESRKLLKKVKEELYN